MAVYVDPTHTAYNTLSAGDVQEIDITYEAKDFDGLTDENNFSITVSGTNDAPTANFNTKQYATENASEAGLQQLMEETLTPSI